MSWGLWVADPEAIDAGVGPKLRDVLDDADLGAERRYVFERDRRLCRTSRWLVRAAVADRVGVDPADILFRRDERGRPWIAGPAAATGVAFSVAHTDGLVAVVEGPGPRVGVDVEVIDRDLDVATLAQAVMTADEHTAMAAVPVGERRRRFLELWVVKEAVLKAVGTGLLVEPTCVSVRIDDGVADARVQLPSAHADAAATCWVVALGRFGPRHVGATAIPTTAPASVPEVTTRDWPSLVDRRRAAS